MSTKNKYRIFPVSVYSHQHWATDGKTEVVVKYSLQVKTWHGWSSFGYGTLSKDEADALLAALIEAEKECAA